MREEKVRHVIDQNISTKMKPVESRKKEKVSARVAASCDVLRARVLRRKSIVRVSYGNGNYKKRTGENAHRLKDD